MTRTMPQPVPPAEPVAAPVPGPAGPLALVRSVSFAEGRFFVLADDRGQPLAVLPDLATAHRIARFFGLEAHTVH